jgi:hypothetical protein
MRFLMDTDLRQVLFRSTVVRVEIAGRALGIGRAAAYAAAKRGDIPTIRIGGAIRVPTAPLRQMLGIDQGEAA